MQCPVCKKDNSPDALQCSCGFFLDLVEHQETKAEVVKDKSKKSASDRYRGIVARNVISGIILIAIGILFGIGVYINNTIDTETKSRFITLGFLIVVYGISIAYRGYRLPRVSGKSREESKY